MGILPLLIHPDPDDTQAAELYVDGLLDGRPYRFLLDTGAARTRVLVDPYTDSFPSHQTHSSSGVFARSSNDLITISRLDVGPIRANSLTVVRAPGSPPEMHNLIGMDVLQFHRCHFQFDEARVLIDEEEESDHHFYSLLTDQKFHPYITPQFGNVTAHAAWDTGASITIVDMAFVQKHPEFFQEGDSSTGTDSTGMSMDTPMYTMAPAFIGDTFFPPHSVAGVDLSEVNAMIEIPMDFILGYSTLRHANWLFDFPNKRWAITKIVTNF